MSLREHLRHLLPHFEFKLLETLGEWLLHHLWGPAVLAVLVAIVQRAQGIPYDWWVLSILFFGSLGLLVYSHRRELRRSDRLSLPVEGSQSQVDLPPLQASSQDAADRKQIASLFNRYAKPAHEAAQPVANELWDWVRNSQDKKDWALAILFKQYGLKPCDLAAASLNYELVGPDKGNTKLLQRELREFCNAYCGLVNWTNQLTRTFSYPLREDPGYSKWQEKHKMFYQKLADLLEMEGDHSELQKGLQREPDIIG